MDAHTPRPSILSTQDIAQLLDRHQVSVWQLIQRLKIKPTVQSGHIKFYSPDDLPKMRAALRPLARDREKAISSSGK